MHSWKGDSPRSITAHMQYARWLVLGHVTWPRHVTACRDESWGASCNRNRERVRPPRIALTSSPLSRVRAPLPLSARTAFYPLAPVRILKPARLCKMSCFFLFFVVKLVFSKIHTFWISKPLHCHFSKKCGHFLYLFLWFWVFLLQYFSESIHIGLSIRSRNLFSHFSLSQLKKIIWGKFCRNMNAHQYPLVPKL